MVLPHLIVPYEGSGTVTSIIVEDVDHLHH